MFNKKKIFNDPIYGFITIPSELIYDIIDHPYFQRLRRIRQLGMADFTYPGALHTRFHHALGAMHLMGLALETLKSKGHKISAKETEAAQIAILLHDIGHGPFSHALEFTLLKNIGHERVSAYLMNELNIQFKGKLSLAIEISEDRYHRKFFHQLVSSQLDIDRLDYLQRDCFFTGVSEGTIGADRIIKMLELVNDELVVEEKGIYSVENFLSARRLMYWQVYLHKTVVSAEQMIIQIITRARDLVRAGEQIIATDALKLFLTEEITFELFSTNPKYVHAFTALDDYDLWSAIKLWSNSEDKVLNFLCNCLLQRRLFKVNLSSEKIQESQVSELREAAMNKLGWDKSLLDYLVVQGSITNAAYNSGDHQINILMRNGKVLDIATASDLPNIKAISKIVKKYYVCWLRM